MYLKSLEINGFKSFGRKVALEFNSPISAIVGPNGSGKSNVAEAFRFVLGEQSIKSMRGKRGEDLIFNGSEAGAQSLSRLNRAGVKVVFDNSKKILPVDFGEVTIERIVHRDGINEYFINGSQVRLKDVHELLSHAHIGASGHHIISQGEADRILSANPKERRSMIEDALGLKIFQYKKQESERKLASTEENMKQVESLRRELAPHLKFLKKQVEKIEKAENVKNELKSLYKEYLKREEQYLKQSKEEIQENLKVPEEELKELKKKLESIQNLLKESEGENKSKLELIDIENKLRETRDEKQHLTHAIGRIEGELNSLNRVLEKAKKEEIEEGNVKVSIKEIEDLVGKVNLEFQEAEKQESIDIIRETLRNVRELFNNFISGHKNTGHNNGNQYEEDIAKLNLNKVNLSDELSKKEEEEKNLNIKLKDITKAIENSAHGSREAEREMFGIMARQTELQGIITNLKTRSHSLALEEDDFKREIAESCILIGREMSEFSNIEINLDFEERSAQQIRRRNVEKLKIRLEELGGGSATETLKEYEETEGRDQFLSRELLDLEKAENDLRSLISELDLRIDTEFKSGILKINHEFQKYFELLFGGGKAKLEVIKEVRRKKSDTDLGLEDMEEGLIEDDKNLPEGIDIQVDLPKKKVRALMMLSGGERALTSIALLFAMSQVNPPPFIILDETDAALDEANSKKYGDMIENLSHYSQLIVITHNRETMSRAGVLYGVTMMQGLSKLLSIKFDEALQVAK